MTKHDSVTLVTGATGHAGREVVLQLRGTGTRIRALTRHPDSSGLPDDVEVVGGDLSDPDSLKACLDGVDAVFLMWPFLTAEGAAPVVEAMGRRARRVVYLSAMSVRDDLDEQADPITTFHAAIERLLVQSDLEWTFLRASGFATNTLGWAPQIRGDGVVRWPYAAAARSLIHERDIAAVAVSALTTDRYGHAKLVLTGPAAVTQVDQVRAIGQAIDRPLRYEGISPDEARRQMAEYLPAAAVDGALSYWAKLVEHPEPVTATVQEVTGTPARPFAQWAIEHASDFSGPNHQGRGA